MNTNDSEPNILQWRLTRAESDAPPPPLSSELIARLRPWWEIWPERFTAFSADLGSLRVTFGHAAVNDATGGSGIPVPTVFVTSGVQTKTVARILFLSLRGNQMRLRFQVDASPVDDASELEVTFVSDLTSQPLTVADASRVSPGEFRVDVELPPELARDWAALSVRDRMPFGLILIANSEA